MAKGVSLNPIQTSRLGSGGGGGGSTIAGSFTQQVKDFEKKTSEKLTKVIQQSALLLTDEVTKPRGSGGLLPVISGNLRKSFAASLSGRPSILWKQRNFSDLANVPSVISDAQPGHTIFLGFRAPYAERVEFSKNGGFWRAAAQKWTEIVNKAAAKVKGGG